MSLFGPLKDDVSETVHAGQVSKNWRLGVCTMNGYFLCVVVHHVPGKQKRKQRRLDETNLDEESLL